MVNWRGHHAQGTTLTDVALRAAGSDGRQRLESLTAKLYEGTLDAQGSLDLRQSPLRMAFTESLSNVQIAPLYADATGETSPLRGRLNLESDVTSRTNRLESLKRHLNGTASLRIDDGAMLDVNVSQQLCTAAALLDGERSDREWSETALVAPATLISPMAWRRRPHDSHSGHRDDRSGRSTFPRAFRL